MTKSALAFAATLCMASTIFAAQPKVQNASLAENDDTLSATVIFGTPNCAVTLKLATEKREAPIDIKMSPKSRNLRDYIDYSTEAWKNRNVPGFKGPERVKVVTCAMEITIPSLNNAKFDYDLLPWFHDGRGIYSRKYTEEHLDEWQKTWGDWSTRKFSWAFHYNPRFDATEIWLDNQFVRMLKNSGKPLSIEIKSPKEDQTLSAASTKWQQKGEGINLAPQWPARSKEILRQNAKLNFDVDISSMKVWSPEVSIDTGEHYQTTKNRDLGWSPMMLRNPFQTGPNYFIWSVPNRKYRYAYILCADIPQEGRIPVLGTHLTHYRNLSSGQIAYDSITLDEDNVKTNKTIRKVGSLSYVDADGKAAKSPLYLVRHKLDFGKISTVFENDIKLDFELVGTGTRPEGKRSSLQIFGVKLVETPYDFKIIEEERGNIIASDEKPVTYVELTANTDNVKGFLEYSIYDPYFKPMGGSKLPFSLAKIGDKIKLEITLKQPKLGWFGLNYKFYDAQGVEIARHEAAFALLGPDDREAGYESPYGAWPHAKGGHGNNPDRKEVLDVMRKAGFHNAWPEHIPVDRESDSPDYPITVSMFHIGNSGKRRSAESVQKDLDKRVAEFRELRERFPHIPMLQLLHEQGGRDMAEEMRFKPAVRGEYKGTNGNWEVYWCTEAAKRFKKEFPDMPIMIGNGSSSSEKVASLCRDGFDLNLIDYLGIESKGFQSLPEEATNRESPGMLWTLRETARRFGYEKKVSACAEYVFRPERRVTPQSGMWRYGVWNDYMWVTDFTLRDYLISLAHGCKCISTGHIEDSTGTYYDTNWGAGGMCKAYPLSYPKRMYVALAAFTRVFDKATFSRRIKTDGNSTYALEFTRDRNVKDYAYAFWTPHYGCNAKVFFPKDAKVTDWEVFGNSTDAKFATDGSVEISFNGTPKYLVSTKPVDHVEIVRHSQKDITAKTMPFAKLTANSFKPKLTWWGNGDYRGVYRGIFKLQAAKDNVMGDYAEFALDPNPDPHPMRWLGGKDWVAITNVPEVVKQFGCFDLKEPIVLETGKTYGIWVKGNSSFAPIMFGMQGVDGTRLQESLVCDMNFEGWHLVRYTPHPKWHNAPVEGLDKVKVTSVFAGSARVSLDPLEMTPITTHPGLGAIVELDNDVKVDADDYYKAIMSTVNDKDL